MASKVAEVLKFNLDKERLEEECRKFLLIRVIDRDDSPFNFELESALSATLTNHFGKAYNHRMELIL